MVVGLLVLVAEGDPGLVDERRLLGLVAEGEPGFLVERRLFGMEPLGPLGFAPELGARFRDGPFLELSISSLRLDGGFERIRSFGGLIET